MTASYSTRRGAGYRDHPTRLEQWAALAAATECDECGNALGDDRAALTWLGPGGVTTYGVVLHRGDCLALILDRLAESEATR